MQSPQTIQTTELCPRPVDDATAESDVGQIWRGAIDRYQVITGKKMDDPDLERSNNVEQILDIITSKESKFKMRRHNDTKLDKFRTLVSQSLIPIQFVGDIVAQATKTMYPPSEAIFAAIRYLISVSQSVSADYDRLANFFEDLRSYLARLSVLENSIPAVPELKVVLTEVLTSILVLCGICTKYMRTNRVVKAFRALMSGEDAELKEAYDNLHKAVEREKGIVRYSIFKGVEQTKRHAQTAITGIKENLTLTERIDNNLRSVVDNSSRVNVYLESQETARERQSLITWLSSLDFRDKQRTVFSKRHKNTGQWLLNSEEFQNWFSASDGESSTLWCTGNPGSGKSVMMSTAVSYLEESTVKSDVAITFVYCDYKDRQTLSETNIWASIVRQLVESCAQIPAEVRAFRDKYLEKRSLPSDEERILLVNSLSRQFQKTFVLIDALDECPEENRDAFLSLAGQVETSVHLLITSRSNLDLTESFEHLSRINISAHPSDVETYLDHKMNTNVRMRSWMGKDPTLRSDVINKLLEKTDGMFLLAHLQIEFLCGRSNLRQVRTSLDSLVGKLEAFYDAALQRIEELEDNDSLLAKKALSYVFHAKKPLTLQELIHALSVESGDPDIDEMAFTERIILMSVTAGLLHIGDDTDDARLIHLTLHEYLTKHQDRFLNPETELARTCLTYLSFEPFGNGPCVNEEGLDGRMRQYAFLSYAAQYWGDHFATAQEQDDVTEILALLEDEARLASLLQAMYIPRHRMDGWHELYPKSFTSLHAVAYWGLYDAFEPVFQTGTSIDHQDSHGMTALHLASRRGFADLVRVLLEKGADTDLMNERGETAMIWAARNGHGMVMELLIASAADVTIEDNEYWTPLHWAVMGRYDSLVKMLLDQYARIESDNLQTNKALILAAEAGTSKTVELLLEQGAEIDWADEEGSPALHWAVPEGHEQTSAVLLKNGADANSRDHYDNTPLHWAIPYEGITRLLLQHGANPNHSNNTKKTPLHWSAQAGMTASIRILLEYGADPNAQDEHGVTALHVAVLQGHGAVVNQLLMNGADVEVKDEDGWTSLHAAIVRGHEALIDQLLSRTDNGGLILNELQSKLSDENERNMFDEMASDKSFGSTVVTGLRMAVNSGYKERIIALLDGGADIDAQDQIGDSTALTQAADQGRADLVLLLLDHGANPNQREKHGQTALHIAAKYGYSDVAAILVDEVADIDATVHGWTPMLLAARNNKFGLPDYLIRRGANVNAADYHGRTALHWAAQHGWKGLARLLLEMGANIGAKDRWGKTAFQWAIANRKSAVAQLLRRVYSRDDD